MVYGSRARQTPTFERFTPGELRVMRLLVVGKRAAEIAALLNIKKRTVADRMCEIYQKLDVHNQAAAMRAIRKLGIGDEEGDLE